MITLIVDVGPKKVIVISGKTLADIPDKLVPSGISACLSDRIKTAMTGLVATNQFLLGGMVEIKVESGI